MNSLATKILSYLIVAAIAVAASWYWHESQLPEWSSKTILVTVAKQEELKDEYRKSWQREPDRDELIAMIDTYVADEFAFRKGMADGLGTRDISVRRRVQELLEEDARTRAMRLVPTDTELEEYLAANADRFVIDQATTFRQIFFDVDANGIGADASARFMLGQLRGQGTQDVLSKYGDPSSLPSEFTELTHREIQNLLGDQFAQQLKDISVGSWSGPIRSSHGLHLVFIDERGGGRQPKLSEIREALQRELLTNRALDAVEQLYESIEDEYRVVVEPGGSL